MSMARGVLCSALFAGTGAALWAGLCHWTEYRLGIVAIVIGGLAGFGMLVGVSGRGRPAAGLAAALVAALAVIGGRYGEHRLETRAWIAEATDISEEEAVASIADEVLADYEEREVEMTWPESFWDEDDQSAESCYPVEVWVAANQRWNSMTDYEQEEHVAAMSAQALADADASGGIAMLGFLIGFGLFDAVWMGLAFSTAYKIGATDAKAKPDEQCEKAATVVMPTAAPGAGFWGSLGKESGTASPAGSTSLPQAATDRKAA